MRSRSGFSPKPPVRRTAHTMSDCEGLPVGKRQIYIYPESCRVARILRLQRHTRSRSRESRKSPKPPQVRVPCSESVRRVGGWHRLGFLRRSRGWAGGRVLEFRLMEDWRVTIRRDDGIDVLSSPRRVCGDGMGAAGAGAVCGSCLFLDKPSRMVTDTARADKCNAKGLFAERKQKCTLLLK